MNSFRPKDGSAVRLARGETVSAIVAASGRPHLSTTDPDARLFRKAPGKEGRVVFIGNALMENRNGLVVGAVATRASGHAERLAVLALIEPSAERPGVMLGAHKGYDTADFVMVLREQGVTPSGAEPERAPLGDRRPHHPPSRLTVPPQAHRGSLWLGQDGSRLVQAAAPRPAQDRLAIHLGNGRL
jgi:hypothetical protein